MTPSTKILHTLVKEYVLGELLGRDSALLHKHDLEGDMRKQKKVIRELLAAGYVTEAKSDRLVIPTDLAYKMVDAVPLTMENFLRAIDGPVLKDIHQRPDAYVFFMRKHSPESVEIIDRDKLPTVPRRRDWAELKVQLRSVFEPELAAAEAQNRVRWMRDNVAWGFKVLEMFPKRLESADLETLKQMFEPVTSNSFLHRGQSFFGTDPSKWKEDFVATLLKLREHIHELEVRRQDLADTFAAVDAYGWETFLSAYERLLNDANAVREAIESDA